MYSFFEDSLGRAGCWSVPQRKMLYPCLQTDFSALADSTDVQFPFKLSFTKYATKRKAYNVVVVSEFTGKQNAVLALRQIFFWTWEVYLQIHLVSCVPK